MKQGWAWLWMWVGVLSLLWFLHPFRCLHHHRPVAEDRAVLGPSESVFAWRTAAPAASTPPAWSRAGPQESFALHSEFLTIHDVGPLWLDHRGSPRPPGCRHLLVTGCKAAGQAGSVENEQSKALTKFRVSREQIQTRGFSTAFSSAAGAYAFERLPAGSYEVSIPQLGLRFRAQTVEVQEGQRARL